MTTKEKMMLMMKERKQATNYCIYYDGDGRE